MAPHRKYNADPFEAPFQNLKLSQRRKLPNHRGILSAIPPAPVNKLSGQVCGRMICVSPMAKKETKKTNPDLSYSNNAARSKAMNRIAKVRLFGDDESNSSSSCSTVDLEKWKTPDSAVDPKSYDRYLDCIFAVSKDDCKRQLYEMMKIQAGDSIIDIGCGTGADALAMFELLIKVGGGGKVVGVDSNETMISEARDRLEHNRNIQRRRWQQQQEQDQRRRGLGERIAPRSAVVRTPRLDSDNALLSESVIIEFRVGDAQNLKEIPSGSFELCRSERSLQNMQSPKAVIGEMVRIAKPAVGRIVVLEPDWETLVIDSPSYSRVTRKIVNYFTDSRVNGWIGRQLPRLFREAGLVSIKVVPITTPIEDLSIIRVAYLDKAMKIAVDSGVVTEEEASSWMAELENMNKEGSFFSSLTHYCVQGNLV